MPRVPQGRVTLFGDLSTGQDQWTMSFAVDPLNARTQGDIDHIASETAAKFVTQVWSRPLLEVYISSTVRFLGVRVDDVQDPGGVVRTGTNTLLVPDPGPSGSDQLPPQSSTVVTLLTGGPGASRRGRMYFPPYNVDALDTNGQLVAGAVSELAAGMANFFADINQDASMGVTVFVASDALQQLTAVNAVRVGTVVDSQRRRRNTVPEAFVQVAV